MTTPSQKNIATAPKTAGWIAWATGTAGGSNATRPRSDTSTPGTAGTTTDPGKININPTSPPDAKTLIYSPDVQILIARNNKQYDVSTDIVAWSVRRVENSVSSAVFRLANKDLRYNQLFAPMDRVVIKIKGAAGWFQVFSGYLDSVPHIQLYPGVVNFRASCTLKRLLYTYWDPGLPAASRIFDQTGPGVLEQALGENAIDRGMGSILRRLLVLVGGWDSQNVHISAFPMYLYALMEAEIKALEPGNNDAVQKFKEQILGQGDTSLGVGTQAGRQLDVTRGAYVATAPERMMEVIKAVDEAGMGPNNTDFAAAVGLGTAATGGTDQKDQEAWKAQTQVGTNWADASLKNDAAVICFMTIMVESPGFVMYANPAVPESLTFPHDAESHDGTSVGLYQQQNYSEWGCLPAWSQVFTASGPVPIVDVREGDEVWSFNGDRIELAKVTGWQMTGHKKLLTIRTAGRTLEVTANHRIPVRRYFGIADGRKVGKCGWDTVEVFAGDIRSGDYLIVPHGMGDGSATTTPDGKDLTVELMELVGLYLGDGNRDNNGRVEIAHGSGVDEDHMPYYRILVSDVLGVTPHVDKRGTRTRFNSPQFRSLIDSWFPGKAHDKRLPGWVFRLTSELQLGLLRGYLDSDGSVDKIGRVRWASVSKGLAEDIRHLCIQLGIPVGKIGVGKSRTGVIRGRTHIARELHTVRASSPRHNIQIGAHSPHKAANFDSAIKVTKSRYDDDWNSSVCRRAPMGRPPEGAVYHRVIDVKYGSEEVPVYDIEVGGLHHYVADGVVVHNSVAQRMNPRESTGIFLQALNRIVPDWRNTNRGTACQAVQRSAFPEKYAKVEAAAIEAVRAIRSGTGTGTGTGGPSTGVSGALTGAPTGGLGATNPLQAVTAGVQKATSMAQIPTSNGSPSLAGAESQILGTPKFDTAGALSCAMFQLGKPYVYGANGPASFDCCLDGLTMVYGPDKATPISELRTGDRVYSLQGDRLVTSSVVRQWRSKDQEVFRVRTRNRAVVGSANHPFLRLTFEKQPDGRKKYNGSVITEWVRLDELSRGDFLVVPKTMEQKNDDESLLPNGKVITPTIAWLIGLMLGDGHLAERSLSCAVWGELAERAGTAFRELGATSVRHYPQAGVVVHSQQIRELLSELGLGEYSRNRRIPAPVWEWGNDLQRAFLDGYCDADGHHPTNISRHGERTYSSASRALVEEVRSLHIMLGDSVSNITVNPRTKPITIKGKLVKNALPLHTFAVWSGKDRGQYIRARMESKSLGKWIDNGDFTITRILDIDPQGVAPTYDIEVEGNHNFIADGLVVHNSGLIQFSYRSIGIELPHNDQAIANVCQRIPASNLVPGDLIIPHPGHIVMYAGPPNMIVEAPNYGTPVITRPAWFSLENSQFYHVPGTEYGGSPVAAFDMQRAMSAAGAAPGTVTNGPNGGTAQIGGSEQIARNLFTYLFFPGNYANEISPLYTGEKAFINDEPLMQSVVSVAQASMRNFQSAPNGDFMAYYPDYFGLNGTNAVYNLEDIEMKNVAIDLNDDALTTHVYVAGAQGPNGIGAGTPVGWLQTSGVVTVENEAVFQAMKAVSPSAPGEEAMSGKEMMRRYGVRPLVQSMASVMHGPMEFILAAMLFMRKWAERYSTQIETTFIPGILPGMRVNLTHHKLQAYVTEVVYAGDWENGFTTSMTIMAPSNAVIRKVLSNVVDTVQATKDLANNQASRANQVAN